MSDPIVTERSILGGILLYPERIGEVLDACRPADLSPRNRAVLEAMLALSEAGDTIDVVTLADALKTRGTLDLAGGLAYLSGLEAYVPASPNLGRYGQIVREDAARRAFLDVAASITTAARDQTIPLAELADRAESAVYAVAHTPTANAPEFIGDHLKDLFAGFEKRFERQSDVTGLATGFASLDRQTAGFQPGDLVIVGGRPSMGKTSLAMQIVQNIAIGGTPGLVFSLEMGVQPVEERMISVESGVDSQRIRTGKFLDSDWPRLARAMDRLHKAPVAIDGTPALTIGELRARARRFKSRHPALGIVAVDYLQLMGGGGDAHREAEISAISRGLKQLARDLAIPVVALSQLNRGSEKRTDRRPSLSDLRESGAIEQDADVVMFVYREAADSREAEIIVGKQRNGPIGTVRLAFDPSCLRFSEPTGGTPWNA